MCVQGCCFDVESCQLAKSGRGQVPRPSTGSHSARPRLGQGESECLSGLGGEDVQPFGCLHLRGIASKSQRR